MVLTFLVASILVVMLICSCYGLCKCPCKRTVARVRQTQGRRSRPMIPLPSPGVVNPSMSSTFHRGQQVSAVNQQQISKLQFGQKQPPLPAELHNQIPHTRYSAPPGASNVIHLGQLQSHSYHSDLEQIAMGSSTNPPSLGRHSGRKYSPNHQPQMSRSEHNPEASVHQVPPSAPQTENDSTSLPPLRVQPMDMPPPYPGMGYPYTPCKSPKTPHGVVHHLAANYLPTASLSHSRRTATKRQARGAVGGGMGGESKLTDIDSVTEEESNSIVSGRERSNQSSTPPPPSYSTRV